MDKLIRYINDVLGFALSINLFTENEKAMLPEAARFELPENIKTEMQSFVDVIVSDIDSGANGAIC